MDMLKQGAQNLKSVGFGSAMPEMRDRVLGVISGDANKAQDDKIKALEAEVAAGRKTKQQAQAEVGMKKGGKVKKYNDGGSLRVDRSPQYANSQMASTRKQIAERAKAFKPELDKASEDYDKATDKSKKRTQPSTSTMAPFDETYKKGGKVSSASKRADGCCIRGKTRA